MTFLKIVWELYFERQKPLYTSLKFAFVTLGRVALDKNSCEFIIISIDKKLSYNRKTLFFIVLKMMIWWIHQIQINESYEQMAERRK